MPRYRRSRSFTRMLARRQREMRAWRGSAPIPARSLRLMLTSRRPRSRKSKPCQSSRKSMSSTIESVVATTNRSPRQSAASSFGAAISRLRDCGLKYFSSDRINARSPTWAIARRPEEAVLNGDALGWAARDRLQPNMRTTGQKGAATGDDGFTERACHLGWVLGPRDRGVHQDPGRAELQAAGRLGWHAEAGVDDHGDVDLVHDQLEVQQILQAQRRPDRCRPRHHGRSPRLV